MLLLLVCWLLVKALEVVPPESRETLSTLRSTMSVLASPPLLPNLLLMLSPTLGMLRNLSVYSFTLLMLSVL